METNRAKISKSMENEVYCGLFIVSSSSKQQIANFNSSSAEMAGAYSILFILNLNREHFHKMVNIIYLKVDKSF